MTYQIVEIGPDGLIVHHVLDAEAALSLWNELDGEVSEIKDDHQVTISITELIAIVAAIKPDRRLPKSRIEVEENEDLEVDEGKEETGGYPDPSNLPIRD